MSELPDIFTPALETWFDRGAPALKYTARQERRQKGEAHTEVWASCLTRCPKRHACERLRLPAQFQEQLTGRDKLRFHYATLGEKAWAAALGYAYPGTQPSVDVRNRGISGTIDVLVHGQVPLEIKWTPLKMQRSHWYQALAYMYALESPYGYVLLDHGNGSWDAIGIEESAGIYRASIPGSREPYTYNGQRFQATVDQIESLLACHELALGSGGETGALACPTTNQCLRIKDDEASRVCPYFCWGDGELELVDDNIIIGGVSWPLLKGQWG